MAKYYVDTCIWIDYWENRSDRLRPIGEFAANFFNKGNSNSGVFIVSDIVKTELLRRYTYDEMLEILSIAENILYIEIDSRQVREAQQTSRILNIPFGDAAHAILARDTDSVLVTRDKHFELLDGIVKIYFPEELL